MTTTSFKVENAVAPDPIKQKLQLLSGTINFQKQSNKGSNGWLFFGTNTIHNQRVAVKFYDWGGDPAFHAEPRTLASIRSKYVVNILDSAFVDNEYAYFITPYFPRGDLDEELCRVSVGNMRAINLTRDVLSGLSHLHAAKFLHRDLKPQNILLSDDDHAVIGDFGSVKKIPEGRRNVPGSGHSLIYRPPESITSREYGVPGDIYQVGVLLYQLLGGYLPYDETAWLNNQELKEYRNLGDYVDKQVYARTVIQRRIERGRVLNMSSMPPWVSAPVKRLIAKSCCVDQQNRYQSCAEFLEKLGSIRKKVNNWCVEEECPTMIGSSQYRIVEDKSSHNSRVQKKCSVGWRYDNSFGAGTVAELVERIEKRNQ